MRFEFKGRTPWGEWITGGLIQGETTAFIVPPHMIFSHSKWSKYRVDPETVELLGEGDFETKESSINQKSEVV